MIELDDLTRSYGDFIAVRHMSCRIDDGEIIGLLGRNGAGKSTTMKLLTGALEPDSGQIRIDGQPFDRHRQTLQRRIGYLPENCPLYPEMTVAEYLDYRARLLGVAAEARGPAIRGVVARAELGPKLMAPIRTLSRGYRQRVGVAQAILHRPDIVILDEPTNGLDPQQIGHMRDLIRDLARHATVIVSTHILQEVEAVCQRVLILRQGELVVDRRLAELDEDRKLWIHTDADAARVRALLADVDGIDGITALAPAGRFELALAAAADAVAPRVARALVERGQQLFELRPQHRNLETLFRDVNAVPVVEAAHA